MGVGVGVCGGWGFLRGWEYMEELKDVWGLTACEGR